MVETKEEWEKEAQSIPLNERKELKDVYKNELEKEQLKDKVHYTPKSHYTFELYNYPQGSREVNISTVHLQSPKPSSHMTTQTSLLTSSMR